MKWIILFVACSLLLSCRNSVDNPNTDEAIFTVDEMKYCNEFVFLNGDATGTVIIG